MIFLQKNSMTKKKANTVYRKTHSVHPGLRHMIASVAPFIAHALQRSLYHKSSKKQKLNSCTDFFYLGILELICWHTDLADVSILGYSVLLLLAIKYPPA